MSNLAFYIARADQARADANSATLEHVRERCLRSEAAWAQLADRAARLEQLRIAETIRKAENPPEKKHEKTIQEDGLQRPPSQPGHS